MALPSGSGSTTVSASTRRPEGALSATIMPRLSPGWVAGILPTQIASQPITCTLGILPWEVVGATVAQRFGRMNGTVSVFLLDCIRDIGCISVVCKLVLSTFEDCFMSVSHVIAASLELNRDFLHPTSCSTIWSGVANT